MNNTQEIKIVTADPSALGLFGLAVITLVASSQKLGITTGVSLVLPWAIFLGATAQLFACVPPILKYNLIIKQNNLYKQYVYIGYLLILFKYTKWFPNRYKNFTEMFVKYCRC